MRINDSRLDHIAAGQPCATPESPTAATRSKQERQWLEREVASAASLSDADRVRILRDLLRTSDAIRRAKSPEENRRAEEARRRLDEPGRARYRALIGRLTGNQ